MNKNPQYNQQSKSEVEEICIYQNIESAAKSGRHSIYINSGSHARKNSNQQYLKLVMFSDSSISKKRVYVYDHAAQITH